MLLNKLNLPINPKRSPRLCMESFFKDLYEVLLHEISRNSKTAAIFFSKKWSLVGQKGHVQVTREHVGEGGGVGYHFWVNAPISN
jgi:hypothetical protein